MLFMIFSFIIQWDIENWKIASLDRAVKMLSNLGISGDDQRSFNVKRL